jgi:hypothetical protein
MEIRGMRGSGELTVTRLEIIEACCGSHCSCLYLVYLISI